VILDKGQEEDWFSSDWIRWCSIISALSFVGFLIRELCAGHPIVELRILKNRNFAIGLTLMTCVGAVLYGTTAALPIFLQTLMGYPALQSGMALSPRGIGAFVTTILVGRLIGKVRNRWLIITGFSLVALASFMLGWINLQIGMSSVVWPSVINGVGVSFIFVPLTTATMGHLQQQQMGNATGMFNLMRNLGGSFGIAFVTTYLARDAQVHQAAMARHLTALDPAFQQQLATIVAALKTQTGFAATEQAYHIIYGRLLDQARLWAFVDNFRLFGLLCLACVPLVFLFKRAKPGTAKVAAH
jgi:DHA2 family multidrug resistance protein